MFPDPAGDAAGDDSRDIVGFALAPRSDAFLFLIRTQGTPSQDNLAFYIDLDFVGRSRYDLNLGLAQSGLHRLTVTQENGSVSTGILTGVQMAFGSVVEIKIPYASLISVLPFDIGSALIEPNFRPMVRARLQAFNGTQRVDAGPEVASYRLVPTPYSLDLPFASNGTAIEFPMNGKWFLSQEGFSSNGSHANIWAYDLQVRDLNGYRSNPPESPNLAHYYNFGWPVFATQTSDVLETYSISDDGDPLSNPPPPTPEDNRVLLTVSRANSTALSLRHFKQSSVVVFGGQTVVRGQRLALVGDSGNSGGPHLHMHLQDESSSSTTFPIALSNVRVSLNATPDDPWARDVVVWQAREAFFVERQVPFGKAATDFDGDGRSDVGTYRNGLWIVQNSSGGVTATPFGGGTDVLVAADYDGDGKTDIAVYRNGLWIIRRSSDGLVTASQFGGGSDVPVPGDYDGDGKTDLAVYRNGLWIYAPSSGGANVAVQFGGGTDVPMPGDYDGDGKADIAVYRSGLWIYKPSSGGANVGLFFGGGTDVPVPADYDGDGKTDFAVYRGGLWIYAPSSGGAHVATFFGGGTDVPVAADYDGDGKTDIAIYRNGLWVYKPSSGGVDVAVFFGGGSDVPLN